MGFDRGNYWEAARILAVPERPLRILAVPERPLIKGVALKMVLDK